LIYFLEPEDIQKVLKVFRDLFEYKVNLNRPSITVKCKGQVDDRTMKRLREESMFYVSFVNALELETLEIVCDLDKDKWIKSVNAYEGGKMKFIREKEPIK
jgi:hypothetical protein